MMRYVVRLQYFVTKKNSKKAADCSKIIAYRLEKHAIPARKCHIFHLVYLSIPVSGAYFTPYRSKKKVKITKKNTAAIPFNILKNMRCVMYRGCGCSTLIQNRRMDHFSALL